MSALSGQRAGGWDSCAFSETICLKFLGRGSAVLVPQVLIVSHSADIVQKVWCRKLCVISCTL